MTRSTKFAKGRSGNPAGRPKGARDRASLAAEALLDGEAETLTRKAIELAKDGDLTALRLCLDRICPVRRDRPVRFPLPAIASPDDLTRATAALLFGVADGAITPSEAAELGKLVDAHVRAVEAVDFARRLTALEEQQDARR